MDTQERLAKHSGIARRLAAESMVLLKNENRTLPLQGSAEAPCRIAVFGVGQIYTVKGGTGSGNVNNLETIPLLSGLERCPALAPDPALAERYRAWCDAHENMCVEAFMEPKGYYNEEMPVSDDEMRALAAASDTALMVLTRVAREGADMRAEPGMLYLTEGEKRLMNQITAVFEKTILILNTAGYLEIGEYVPKFTAVLFMGLPGQDASAVADVLCGDVPPSGHLTDTWPLHYTQYPSAKRYSEKYFNGNIQETMGQMQEQVDVFYEEDIYVGYRYFDTFGEDVLFPFGYGLTYGTTALHCVSIDVDGETIHVTGTIRNTDETFSARQVLQVYLSCPAGRLEQPRQKLAAFGKTGELLPDGEEILSLTFRLSDFASFDEAAYSYVLERGYYDIRVGFDSRSTAVCGSVCLPEPVTTQVLSDRMGHVPDDFRTLSAANAKPITYPGELAELENARKNAVCLSADDFQTRTVRYGDGPTLRTASRTSLRLSDVLAGTCTVEELAASMEPADLCALACGIGMDLSGLASEVPEDSMFSQPANGILGGGGLKVPGAAGETADLTDKYGIPPISLSDGPAGLRIARDVKDDGGNIVKQQLCTAFPVGSLLASSWDMDVLRQFGGAVAREMLEYGVDLWLAPGMNIHRNPLCGRNYEYFSEDPLLSGLCAAAITEGVQRNGVGVTIKHFAGNNQETLRTNSNDIVTQRALREIYFKGFEIAVKRARPWCIMTSYNDINGVPAANNYDLCTAIAREEWGFDGFIMTDWGGGISSPAISLYAGNDMIQPGGMADIETLKAALKTDAPTENRGVRPFSHKLTLADLQRSAAHIIGVIARCGSVKALLKKEQIRG